MIPEIPYPDLAAVGPVLSGVAVMIVGWLTYRSSRRTDESSPYQALADRVVKLESQVGELRSQVETLQTERVSILEWIRDLYTDWDVHRLNEVPPKLPPEWNPFRRRGA